MNENENVVELNTDAARSKTRAFFARHSGKLKVAALSGLAVGSFLAGRRSKNVVESVDVEVNLADNPSTD